MLLDDREFFEWVAGLDALFMEPRALGGPGSGHFGHKGIPGQRGGSLPGAGGADSAGGAGTADADTDTDIWGARTNAVYAHFVQSAPEIQSMPWLEDQAQAGIAAVDALFVAETGGDPEAGAVHGIETTTEEWDDLSHDQQQDAFNTWRQDQDFYADIDTSYIDSELRSDLRKNNEDIAAEAEKEMLEHFRDPTRAREAGLLDTDPTLPLPGENQDWALVRQIDPESIVYDDDDGDGSPLLTEELRFKGSDEPLTAVQQAAVAAVWDREYAEAFDNAFDKARDSDSYSEQVSALESQAAESAWDEMSDSDKFKYALEGGSLDGVVRVEGGVVVPGTWHTGTSSAQSGGENYARSQLIARRLVELRTEQIAKERGLDPLTPGEIVDLWNQWKSDSQSPGGRAMQLAAAEELRGVHRFSPEDEREIRRFDGDQANLGRTRAYVRAQWEVTQWLMNKTGENEVNVYRAVFVKPEELGDFDSAGEPGARYPKFRYHRSGAQSCTADADVANDWQGVGDTRNGVRAVLRIRAPRTSVLSLPVYGRNVQHEREVVLFGARDRWQWDVWNPRAPLFAHRKIAA